jgi:hypothetical protein
MAEVAAGLVAAEQILATGVEAAAAVVVAKPSLPLKATLSQIPPPQSGADSHAQVSLLLLSTMAADRLKAALSHDHVTLSL